MTDSDIRPIPTGFISKGFPNLVGSLRGDKSSSGVFDNTKIKRLVPGFVCRKSFAEGIRESADWFCERPEAKIVDLRLNRVFDEVVEAFEQSSLKEARRS